MPCVGGRAKARGRAGGWAEEEDAEAGERAEGVRRERRREGRASKRAEGRGGDERRTRKRRRWIWGEWIRGGGGEWIRGGGLGCFKWAFV